ncbi:hypothetical protein ACJJIK_02175 [Microbulbifer sp. ZKSA006]|uniref:hypothetical protein n=1 Tax=Microbulbifer sp. ZKSA006 TaxID=3243390 RepID=UPI0040396246
MKLSDSLERLIDNEAPPIVIALLASHEMIEKDDLSIYDVMSDDVQSEIRSLAKAYEEKGEVVLVGGGGPFDHTELAKNIVSFFQSKNVQF